GLWSRRCLAFPMHAFLLIAAVAVAGVDMAATRGTVGDIPNGFVAPTGLMIDLQNNDFLGGTDKYMTGEAKAGLLRHFEDDGRGCSSSYELTMNWRALEPTSSESVGGKKLPREIGRWADWAEGELAYARTYALGNGHALKAQLDLGAGNISDKGI